MKPSKQLSRVEKVRICWVLGIAFALVALSVVGGVARASEKSTIRWDIVRVDFATLTVSPGGHASAHTIDGSRIRLTGSGTFEPGGDEVTGGGTWRTFDASGTQTGSGQYRAMRLVSWYAGPGTLPCPPITDNVGNCADVSSGLAVLQIRYSNGGVGKLVVSCRLPVGPSPSMYEGVTASKGFVDYFFPEDAEATGNGTAFHVTPED